MPLSTPISKAEKRDATLKKNIDPFKHMHEEMVDDVIEELSEIAANCPEDIDDELDAYDCTRKQLIYWLKKKYVSTTSCGEDLLESLLAEV